MDGGNAKGLSGTILAHVGVLRTLILVFVFSLSGMAASAEPTDEKDMCTADDGPLTPSPLEKKYHQLKKELDNSVFGSPILVTSENGDQRVKGDVYVLLETPFLDLNETLTKPAQWCELAILHINIKACTYRDDEVQIFVGRKHYQDPIDAHPVRYRFELPNNGSHDLTVKLTAADGPLGTSDYLISVNAIPIDEQHSFIHFTYRYQYGFLADLAMSTYLATLGRHKVGFTVTGKNKRGEPVYIQGLQGVIERNAMRYIFAIQTLLETKKSPEENRQTEQLNRWFDYISKYPKQLKEVRREKYLANKKIETANQKELQESGGLLDEE